MLWHRPPVQEQAVGQFETTNSTFRLRKTLAPTSILCNLRTSQAREAALSL